MWREFFKPIMWHSNPKPITFRRSNENRSMYVCMYILRVRSFRVIWIRISDPRSVWIMVHQRNWCTWIHRSQTDLDHRSPQRNAPYVILRVMWPEHDLAMMDACYDNPNTSISTEGDHGVYPASDQ